MSFILYQSKDCFLYNFKKFLDDINSSIKQWRIFILLGVLDIKKRYSRSKFGQFWLTLPLAINIATISILWSYLFKINMATYLPYFAISIIFWNFLNSIIIEGASIFITYTSHINESNLPKTIYIFSLFVKNLITLGHNLIILIPIYFFLKFNISLTSIILSFLGIIITILFLFPIVLTTATITLRFRDLPSIIFSFVQILFYATPIMWNIELMPAKIQNLLILNPFNIFLSLCRDPLLLTNALYPTYWLLAIGYTIISWLVGISIFCKYRKRIIYWL